MASHLLHVALLTVLILSTSVWVGGYVAIAVVARTATTALDPIHRVALFRSLGRNYLRVGLTALVIALAASAALLHDHPWDTALIVAVIVAVALILSLAFGVIQARRMTRLRRSALADPADQNTAARLASAAHRTAALRGLIGLLSLVTVVLGSVLAG